MPASIVVVMPLVTASTQARVAESSSSSPVCAACTGTAQREDRLAGGQVVGDRRADQAVAGQVLVGVDEARRHDRARPAERGHAGMATGRLAPGRRPRGSSRPPPATAPSTRTVRASSIVTTWSPATMRSGTGGGGVGSLGTVWLEWSDGQTIGGHSVIFARVPDRAALRPPGPPAALVRRRPQRRSGPRAGRGHAARTRSTWSGGTATAAVVAAPDRCPHREAPLSLGRLLDGDLECAYHGWRFGRGGRCVLVPSAADGVPLPPKAHLGDRPCRRALRPRLAVPR